MHQETCKLGQAGAWPAVRRRMLPGWHPRSRLQLSGKPGYVKLQQSLAVGLRPSI